MEIPGTTMSYPVVHTHNNSYYLNHTFYGMINKAGCIFMERKNQEDFSDDITVLYGHNLLNGAMFSPLTNYQDATFFNTNDTLYIYRESGKDKYKIVSAYTATTKDKAYTLSLSNDLISYIKSKSVHPSNIKVTTKSKLILLSTCTNRDEDERFIAIFKKV